MNHRLARFVENRVIDVAGLEEEFPRSVDDGFVRQDVGHIAGCYLTNSGPDVVVFAHVSPGRKGQLCDPKLIFSIEISEKSREWGFELNFCDQTLGVDLHRAPTGLPAGCAATSRACANNAISGRAARLCRTSRLIGS